MACDKHIIICVLILMATVFIIYINIVSMMEKDEPNKFLILTYEQVRSNALKRRGTEVRLKSGKNITSPEHHHEVLHQHEVLKHHELSKHHEVLKHHEGLKNHQILKHHEGLNVDSDELKIRYFMKKLNGDFLKEGVQLENSKSSKSPVTGLENQHKVLNLDSEELENNPYLNVFYNKFEKKYEEDREVTQFEDYLRKFNKSYSGAEWNRRFWNFKQSLKELELQGSHTGARHGLTKFSDWSKHEFAAVMNNKSYKDESCASYNQPCLDHYKINESGINPVRSLNDSFVNVMNKELPDRLDWREKRNVIGPVLDQKLCNGCWAFGIIGLMESMAVIQGIESYYRRSIQELLDCSDETRGCKGGHVSRALHFLCHYRAGVETEDQYPLMLVKEPCKHRIRPDLRKVKQFWTVCNMNDTAIKRRLQLGPVIAVVNPEPLKNYLDGIIRRSCFRSKDGYSMDHVVQIVGYNLEGDIPYYILKNSWGSDWGDEGYFKVELYKELCGVNDEVSYLDVY